MNTPLYKILTPAQWEALQRDGIFDGSPSDHHDGFVHLSAAAQVLGTLERHFKGQDDVVIAEVELDEELEQHLRWEPSRGGALFPHLYASLPLASVRATHRLPLDPQILGLTIGSDEGP